VPEARQRVCEVEGENCYFGGAVAVRRVKRAIIEKASRVKDFEGGRVARISAKKDARREMSLAEKDAETARLGRILAEKDPSIAFLEKTGGPKAVGDFREVLRPLLTIAVNYSVVYNILVFNYNI
jgi:hypothetical protein